MEKRGQREREREGERENKREERVCVVAVFFFPLATRFLDGETSGGVAGRRLAAVLDARDGYCIFRLNNTDPHSLPVNLTPAARAG
jgi:hypothetical protein